MQKLAAIAVALVALSGFARAQSGGQDIDYGAMKRAKTGDWAEYSASMSKGTATKLKLKITLVEKTAKNMTIEMVNSTPAFAINAHLEYTAEAADQWKLSGGKLTMGNQPAQPLPPEQLAQAAPIKKGGEPGKLVGEESVTTPAGEFKCRHYKKTVPMPAGQAEVDMWMSDKVAPTGLVKQVIQQQGVEVVLQKMGSK